MTRAGGLRELKITLDGKLVGETPLSLFVPRSSRAIVLDAAATTSRRAR